MSRLQGGTADGALRAQAKPYKVMAKALSQKGDSGVHIVTTDGSRAAHRLADPTAAAGLLLARAPSSHVMPPSVAEDAPDLG